MLFCLLKHHFDLKITDTALKVSRSLYFFTTSISHGVENYFPRLWGTGISDAIFMFLHFRLTFLYYCVLGLFSAVENGKHSHHIKENGTIQLHPSKRRTRGKKSPLTNMKCSLL